MVEVGYALTEKKVHSFMRPELIDCARKGGVNLVRIDPSCPLPSQGPFDVILHKLPLSDDWVPQLEAFMVEHPDVIICDPPTSIKRLANRQSMLQIVGDIKLPSGTVTVPRQLVVHKGTDADCIVQEVAKAGLRLPLVAKPLLVTGTAASHKLALAHNELGLANLRPPLVLQEFVNHGGVVFKVYVVGDSVSIVRRKSLPDVDDRAAEESRRRTSEGDSLEFFARVSSNASTLAYEGFENNHGHVDNPPQSLVEDLARELRFRLGLHLFNLDLIRRVDNPEQYYVIDINYFPGYAKMPGYEAVFTKFLQQLVEKKDTDAACGDASRQASKVPRLNQGGAQAGGPSGEATTGEEGAAEIGGHAAADSATDGHAGVTVEAERKDAVHGGGRGGAVCKPSSGEGDLAPLGVHVQGGEGEREAVVP